MHKLCWEKHHDRPRTATHTFDSGLKDYIEELEKRHILHCAQDGLGAGVEGVKALVAHGGVMGVAGATGIVARNAAEAAVANAVARAVPALPLVPDPTFLERVLPMCFSPAAPVAPVAPALALPASQSSQQVLHSVCATVNKTNVAVASVIATLEVGWFYKQWCDRKITAREFQIVFAGASSGAAGGVMGAAFASAEITLPAVAAWSSASPLAGSLGIVAGGMGPTAIVLLAVLVGGVLGAGVARMTSTKLTQFAQKRWYKSKHDEEKELLYIILAAERMNLVQSEHPLGFTEKILNTAWRRRALQHHPDQNPLSRYDEAELEEEFEIRKSCQQTSFELAQIDWIVLKKFLIDRDGPLNRWDPWKPLIVKRWAECRGIVSTHLVDMRQSTSDFGGEIA